MAKNGYKQPNFLVQALKTPYFLITNVIGPIQGQKRGKTIPPLQNPPNKSLWCVKSCPQGLEFRERERPEILVLNILIKKTILISLNVQPGSMLGSEVL